jgi:hypothetical protein
MIGSKTGAVIDLLVKIFNLLCTKNVNNIVAEVFLV